MTKKLLGFLLHALLAPAFGCATGDPDGGIAGGPLSRNSSADVGVPTTQPSSNGAPATTAAGAHDAAADQGSGFRDPMASDAGCGNPNKLCPTEAGTVCLAVQVDVDNCGKCGNQCTGPNATCIAGNCACTGTGFDYCSNQGGCIDVTSDINNCGSCGLVCDPNQFNACVDSNCVLQ
jgi:hypothetical protein